MRLEKYTLGHRNLGQAEGAHKVGASMGSLKMLAFLGHKQRCSQSPLKSEDFNGERSDYLVLGREAAATD